jgi:hypothetical protein
MPASILPGIIEKAPAGKKGFDVNSQLSANHANNIRNAGYDFCIRYIPRKASLIKGNITHQEALDILNAGLALMVVQHVDNPGWVASADLGKAYGAYAVEYVGEFVGLPPGVIIWLDLEEVSGSDQAIIDYCNTWYEEVKNAGYEPGIYCGFGTQLSSIQLYQKLKFQHYWRAYNGPDVAVRGYQLLQKTQKLVDGFWIDPNETQDDNHGGKVQWLTLTPFSPVSTPPPVV